MKTNLGISDDYATMYVQGDKSWDEDNTKLSFYYGYEVTENNEDDGEWMFVVKKNGKVIKSYTTTQIESNSNDSLRDMSEYLLIGINMYLNEE